MSTGQPMMTPEEAASYIRTAFGKEPWRKKARNIMRTPNLVQALWLAQKYARSENLGDVIKWAYEMGRADTIHCGNQWR